MHLFSHQSTLILPLFIRSWIKKTAVIGQPLLFLICLRRLDCLLFRAMPNRLLSDPGCSPKSTRTDNWCQSSSSSLNSKISPGWQLSSIQIALSVENRIAFALPVFKMDKFAFVMPTLSESSLSDIFRFAIITSRFTIIPNGSPPLPSDCQIVFVLKPDRFVKHPRERLTEQAGQHPKYRDHRCHH